MIRGNSDFDSWEFVLKKNISVLLKILPDIYSVGAIDWNVREFHIVMEVEEIVDLTPHHSGFKNTQATRKKTIE